MEEIRIVTLLLTEIYAFNRSIGPGSVSRSEIVFTLSPTSQAYEWVVEFSRQVLSVILGYICRMLKVGR